MPTRIRFPFAVLVAGLMLTVASCTSDDAAQAPSQDDAAATDARTPAIMWKKMALAHDLLDALAVNNYDAIEQSADALTLLSEQSDWFIHDTPSYSALSERFRGSTRALAEAAQQRNQMLVSETYFSMVRECLACHRYLRTEGLYREMPGQISDGSPASSGDLFAAR